MDELQESQQRQVWMARQKKQLDSHSLSHRSQYVLGFEIQS
jgi:hypothetical protein